MLHFLSLMRSFLAYQVTESSEEITEGETYQSYKYPNMVKTRTGFKLSVMKGSFNDSQIIVLLPRYWEDNIYPYAGISPCSSNMFFSQR